MRNLDTTKKYSIQCDTVYITNSDWNKRKTTKSQLVLKRVLSANVDF